MNPCTVTALAARIYYFRIEVEQKETLTSSAFAPYILLPLNKLHSFADFRDKQAPCYLLTFQEITSFVSTRLALL